MTTQENDMSKSHEKITWNLRSRLRIILWISALTLVFSYLCGQIHAAYLEGADRTMLMGKYVELIVLQEQEQIVSEVMLDQLQTLEKRLKLLEATLIRHIPGSDPCISALTTRHQRVKDNCNDASRGRAQMSIPVGDAKRPEATIILNWNSPDEVDAALKRSAPSLLLVLILALAGTSLIFWLLERDIMGPIVAIARQRERDAALVQAVHMLAHDIRRPLGMISIYIDKIESARSFQEFSDALKRYAPAIKKGTLSLAAHLEDILTLGQNIAVKIEKIKLADVAKESFHDLSHATNKPSLVFTVEDHTQGFQHADPNKMRRVFDNLISNAIEASGTHGVIKVMIDEDRKKTYFSVLNSGNTISPEIFPSIFEPFQTQGKPNGTGLGLAIVKNFINAQGGQITCKNIENWGVLFEFWLPKIADLPGIYASKGDELQEEAQSHFNNGHIHTLFVDDDPIYQDHFKTQFDSISIPGISFSLVICSSSEEALATYMHCKPDLIISDGFLGSNSLCDGRSLLKVINQLSPYAQTILYSSHFNKNDVKERTLNKPASALEIKNHILRTLELSITNHQKLSHG